MSTVDVEALACHERGPFQISLVHQTRVDAVALQAEARPLSCCRSHCGKERVASCGTTGTGLVIQLCSNGW